MAKISLTIPVIAFASVWIELPLLLGWTPTQRVLFVLTVIVAVVTVVPEQGDATAGHSAPRTVGRLHVSRNQPLAPPARAIRPTPQVSAAGRWVVPRIPTSERDQKTGVCGRQWSRLKQARAV